LLAACKAYPLRPWEKLTFEYVLLKGVNDTDADARRVVRLLANLNAKVNLIGNVWIRDHWNDSHHCAHCFYREENLTG